jgi:hypothetical protein
MSRGPRVVGSSQPLALGGTRGRPESTTFRIPYPEPYQVLPHSTPNTCIPTLHLYTSIPPPFYLLSTLSLPVATLQSPLCY